MSKMTDSQLNFKVPAVFSELLTAAARRRMVSKSHYVRLAVAKQFNADGIADLESGIADLDAGEAAA